MTRTMDAAGAQDQGARAYQEDVYAIVQQGEGALCLLLADGMGGHAGGRDAAAAAIDAAQAECTRRRTGRGFDLQASLETADKAVKKLIKANPAIRDGGCTFVAASLVEGALHWISVGDSPLYLVSGGRVNRLNADHSMAPVLRGLVEAGRLDESELARHPQRNALRSSLSVEPTAMIDHPAAALPLRAGEVVILASDGLDTLTHEEIGEVVMRRPTGMAALAQDLIAAVLAKQYPHQDNVTVLCATLLKGEDEAATRMISARARSQSPPRQLRVPAWGLVSPGRVGWALILGAGLALLLAAIPFWRPHSSGLPEGAPPPATAPALPDPAPVRQGAGQQSPPEQNAQQNPSTADLQGGGLRDTTELESPLSLTPPSAPESAPESAPTERGPEAPNADAIPPPS